MRKSEAPGQTGLSAQGYLRQIELLALDVVPAARDEGWQRSALLMAEHRGIEALGKAGMTRPP
ncbi:hypothetical protein Asp14428_06490 [Actinoplanes sp. NBRC 14428]|uniref:Uncharacterized protein n=1 Tax=Pseudosporangium ferrugineum TaxID=439699 RepID=A0A2T0SHI7_9ACTN|nr:hypothetical protein [Pseudosporangium ferrugineum]PRY32872.1 hypothetical protein CLV70_10131 [Pseudosporangium ferrugineum]BCJ49174.1 hypothetical protein Asp14428_06490 [Actinoplanes sp. NBRC 14428]